jgi:hypothetical protein
MSADWIDQHAGQSGQMVEFKQERTKSKFDDFSTTQARIERAASPYNCPQFQ